MRTYTCNGIIRLTYNIKHDHKEFKELNQIELLNAVKHCIMPKFKKDKKALQRNLPNAIDIKARMAINFPHEEVPNDVIILIEFTDLPTENELKASQIKEIFNLDTLFQFDCLNQVSIRPVLLSCYPVDNIKN